MLSLAEINKKLQSLNDWSIDMNILVKEFTFQDFKGAMDFVNKVSDLAQRNSHLPEILISGKVVRLMLTTLTEKSITEKDFLIAEEIDKLINNNIN
jgi:4a-hydroxytetrahydrobiopterin dehydratase